MGPRASRPRGGSPGRSSRKSAKKSAGKSAGKSTRRSPGRSSGRSSGRSGSPSPSGSSNSNTYEATECEIGRFVQSIIRTLLFSFFTVFLLSLPLGDPEIKCSRSHTYEPRSRAVIYTGLCTLHDVVTTAVGYGTVALEQAVDNGGYLITNILYDTKIGFYKLLDRLDNQDLRRIVCTDPDFWAQQEKPPGKRKSFKRVQIVSSKCDA